MTYKHVISLSVIVPVYNAEQYLANCIDSILRQSFGDFELLLINDGSTDQSPEICTQYASADSRIKVIHQENQGVSAARNHGLDIASGEWLTFCDADDWIAEDFFKELMEDREYDLVLSSYHSFVNGTVTAMTLPDLKLQDKLQVGGFLQQHLAPFSVCFSSPWGKRFSRGIVEDHELRFDVQISSGEDTLWVFDYYLKLRSMKVLSFQGYFYRQYYSEKQLSAAALNKLTIDYTLGKLFDRLDRMESAMQQDFSACRYNVLLTYFLKLRASLRAGSLLEVRNKLRKLSSNADFDKLWRDRRYLLKGERRQFFDRLMLNRHFLMLAVYVKLTKQLY